MEYTNEKLGVFRLTCTNCGKRLHLSYRLDENGKLVMVKSRGSCLEGDLGDVLCLARSPYGVIAYLCY